MEWFRQPGPGLSRILNWKLRLSDQLNEIDPNEMIDGHIYLDRVRYEKVLRYWFLLESNMAKAIAKCNFNIINQAELRIEYPRYNIHSNLLRGDLKVEGEALCAFYRVLMNRNRWGLVKNKSIEAKRVSKATSKLGEGKKNWKNSLGLTNI